MELSSYLTIQGFCVAQTDFSHHMATNKPYTEFPIGGRKQLVSAFPPPVLGTQEARTGLHLGSYNVLPSYLKK